MFKLLTENWTLKLLSLAFALILWIFIMGERRQEVGYRVPLELRNIPAGLMIANEVPSMVDVRVSGPRTLLMKVSEGDISIAVDLADLQPGLTTFKRLEERLNLPNGLRVTRLSPSFIDLKLERIKEKLVPIKVALRGEPLEGYQVGRVKAVPDRVLITGAESELKSVNEVTTEPIDLHGVNEGFSLIVSLVHLGTYTDFKDEKTTEVQVEVLAVEPVVDPSGGGMKQKNTDVVEKGDKS
ncbi:YbbR-like domain-containing protein [Malonomonas rubra]|uniref:CdaR family protein n=1 Tax=Malonomonas rubra TaxID=57040 RepID=UPI0026EC87D4|nr:CdaR family protein [Malonomonas rubra]